MPASRTSLILSAAAVLVLVLAATGGGTGRAESLHQPAPPFTRDDPAGWVNGGPLTLADLAGHVVLIDVWTFDCWNCYRSFPWLKAVERRHRDRGLRVVGIHAPEFEHERVRANVAAKVREFGLEHPVMIDNDFAYWRALGNRYWPTFYVMDREGIIRGRFIGETHAGDRNAEAVEALIEALLGPGP